MARWSAPAAPSWWPPRPTPSWQARSPPNRSPSCAPCSPTRRASLPGSPPATGWKPGPRPSRRGSCATSPASRPIPTWHPARPTARWCCPRRLLTLHRVVALLGVALCGVLLPIALHRRHRVGGFLALVLLALPVNALITGGLSGPHDRYQSRMMWLPPLLAALAIPALAQAARQTAGSAAGHAKETVHTHRAKPIVPSTKRFFLRVVRSAMQTGMAAATTGIKQELEPRMNTDGGRFKFSIPRYASCNDRGSVQASKKARKKGRIFTQISADGRGCTQMERNAPQPVDDTPGRPAWRADAPIVPWGRLHQKSRKQESKISNTEKKGGGTEATEKSRLWRFAQESDQTPREAPESSLLCALCAASLFLCVEILLSCRPRQTRSQILRQLARQQPTVPRLATLRPPDQASSRRRFQATTPVRHIAPANAARFSTCRLCVASWNRCTRPWPEIRHRAYRAR